MTNFINNKATSELVGEKIKENWIKDLVTNNTRIEEVWRERSIKDKKEAYQKDNIKIRNLREEPAIPENIAHIDRNADIWKIN